MTEAEKALLDFVLRCGDTGEIEENRASFYEYVAAVHSERVGPDAKRLWITAYKVRERACRNARMVFESLGLPPGFDASEWREEAKREMENE